MHPIQKQLYDLDKLRSLIDNPDIEIIRKNDDALKNQILFDETYYHEGFPKIVLCGINPGRLGAGITGIPFVDPPTLAKRLPDNNIKGEEENSAKFFNEIIDDHFGVDKFYKHFYVTNFSWVGFTEKINDFKKINLDYWKLPTQAKKYIEKAFKREMTLVNPTKIIPLGVKVEESLNRIFINSEIEIEKRLMHPSACVPKKRRDKCNKDYPERLKSYII
jgi:hypothetical protein